MNETVKKKKENKSRVLTLERAVDEGSVARHVAAYFGILKTTLLRQVGQAEINKQSCHYSYPRDEDKTNPGTK